MSRTPSLRSGSSHGDLPPHVPINGLARSVSLQLDKDLDPQAARKTVNQRELLANTIAILSGAYKTVRAVKARLQKDLTGKHRTELEEQLRDAKRLLNRAERYQQLKIDLRNVENEIKEVNERLHQKIPLRLLEACEHVESCRKHMESCRKQVLQQPPSSNEATDLQNQIADARAEAAFRTAENEAKKILKQLPPDRPLWGFWLLARDGREKLVKKAERIRSELAVLERPAEHVEEANPYELGLIPSTDLEEETKSSRLRRTFQSSSNALRRLSLSSGRRPPLATPSHQAELGHLPFIPVPRDSHRIAWPAAY